MSLPGLRAVLHHRGVGKGTGLGLSQVLGFVKQSGGHVKIYSEPDHGTTIKIYLPRFKGIAEELLPVIPAEEARTGQRHEVVLVVEDEERMLQLSCDAFRELGYTVLHAAGPMAALRVHRCPFGNHAAVHRRGYA
jgi:hypothetical protein